MNILPALTSFFWPHPKWPYRAAGYFSGISLAQMASKAMAKRNYVRSGAFLVDLVLPRH